MIALRPAREEDLPQLAKWNRELIAEEGSRNAMTQAELLGRMQSWLETDWDIRIIEADGRPAGYLIGRIRLDEYVPETMEYYLRQFYILPAFRRMGIGQSAIQQMREELFPKVSAIVLDVLESNAPGRSFWGSLGFEPQYTTMKLTGGASMPNDAEAVTRAALDAAANCLAECLDVIAHCLDQLSDKQIWWRPEPAMNSVGNLLIHLEGNLKQWITLGLTGRPDTRNRPSEFAAQGGSSKTDLFANLSQTVHEAAEVLKTITPNEMLAERRIQGFSVNGWDAVFNSLPHFKGHTQEIVCLTRQQKGPAYKFHWTPQSPEEGAPSAG